MTQNEKVELKKKKVEDFHVNVSEMKLQLSPQKRRPGYL